MPSEWQYGIHERAADLLTVSLCSVGIVNRMGYRSGI